MMNQYAALGTLVGLGAFGLYLGIKWFVKNHTE